MAGNYDSLSLNFSILSTTNIIGSYLQGREFMKEKLNYTEIIGDKWSSTDTFIFNS